VVEDFQIDIIWVLLCSFFFLSDIAMPRLNIPLDHYFFLAFFLWFFILLSNTFGGVRLRVMVIFISIIPFLQHGHWLFLTLPKNLYKDFTFLCALVSSCSCFTFRALREIGNRTVISKSRLAYLKQQDKLKYEVQIVYNDYRKQKNGEAAPKVYEY